MSDTKTVDVSHIAFASTVFPTAEDKALWASLPQVEQLAIIERDEDAGFASGVAHNASMQEVLAKVRSEAGK